jgi:hypothetical protein
MPLRHKCAQAPPSVQSSLAIRALTIARSRPNGSSERIAAGLHANVSTTKISALQRRIHPVLPRRPSYPAAGPRSAYSSISRHKQREPRSRRLAGGLTCIPDRTRWTDFGITCSARSEQPHERGEAGDRQVLWRTFHLHHDNTLRERHMSRAFRTSPRICDMIRVVSGGVASNEFDHSSWRERTSCLGARLSGTADWLPTNCD